MDNQRQNKKIRTFTVKRSKWLRGEYDKRYDRWKGKRATLLNNKGHSCCLGFVGISCGIPRVRLASQVQPDMLDEQFYKMYPKLKKDDWDSFIAINDDCNLSDAEREIKLQKLANRNGFRFKFVK